MFKIKKTLDGGAGGAGAAPPPAGGGGGRDGRFRPYTFNSFIVYKRPISLVFFYC